MLEAVNNRDLITLILVASGAGFGIVTFARLLGWLFKKHHDMTIAVLTGLMLGSLRKVWPWKETLKSINDGLGHRVPIEQANIIPAQWNSEVLAAVSLAILGFSVVFCLNLWAERKGA